MKFSLIMATLGRSAEVVSFLDSLSVQTYRSFELYIIDQNNDNRVYDLYLCYKDTFSIIYIRSTQKGLSRNRNIGLERCFSGNNLTDRIIAFPDDDCEYEQDTLEKAAAFFTLNHKYGLYTCNTRQKDGNGAVLDTKKVDSNIGIFNLMRIGISFTIFVRAEAMGNFRFDEQLGVGAAYGSGEESDLLLYLLKAKYKGRYHSKNYIYHPAKKEDLVRVYDYSRGFGAVHKKAVTVYHLYPMLFIFVYRMVRNLIKFCLFPRHGLTRTLIKGRLNGFMQYASSVKVLP